MAMIHTTRVWVGECVRQQNITSSQLANTILTTISPDNIGNHNKKLMQLLQNILCQLFGEADTCLAEHGTLTCDLMMSAFSNSVAVLFGPNDHTHCTMPAEFINIVDTYTTPHPDIFRPFVVSAITAFTQELYMFINAWCKTYDKVKPDTHPLEMMLHYKFGAAGSASFTINNLVATKVTTAHSISKHTSRQTSRSKQP